MVERLPDLTIRGITYGSLETPRNLSGLLYHGGAALPPKTLKLMLSECALGEPMLERVGLVARIHEEIEGFLQGGGSRHTAIAQLSGVKRFFSWADSKPAVLSLATCEACFAEPD